MPNYAYKCSACEHQFEKMLSISDRNKPEKAKCPECGEKKVNQYFGNSNVSIGDAVRLGKTRPNDGFREVLHKIHGKMPGSKLNESRYF